MNNHSPDGIPKSVKCNYGNCERRFDSIKDMQRHKANSPDHYYCRRCDVDCEDWEGLTLHKVLAMKPFLDKLVPLDGSVPLRHIVCEFCGENFGSFGGRELHRLHHHQADQHISCPGCKKSFTRGGDLIWHLEMGQCDVITRNRFYEFSEQKLMTEQIWRNAGAIQESFTRNQESKELRQLLDAELDDQDVEAGGVDLLGFEEECEESEMRSVRAGLESMDVSERKWPRLPGQRVDSGVTTAETALPATPTDAEFHFEKDWDPARQPSSSAQAWSTGQTSKTLFATAQPTPPAGDWDAILNSRRSATQEPKRPGLLTLRFWDPKSPDWDPTLFYNHVTSRYICPFEDCTNCAYETIPELEGHLHYRHLDLDFTCPLCGKRFKSASGLVSHSEAPAGRCRVKHTKMYGKLLDQVSGGFLKAEILRLPRLARTAKAREEGLMAMRFTALEPERVEMNGKGITW